MSTLERRLIVLATTLAVLACQPRALRASDDEELVVVVSVGVPLTDITLATLRLAFRGEYATFTSGKRLIPFNLPQNTAERDRFDRAVLGLEPDEVGRFWIQRRIRDEGMPPRTLPSPAVGLRVVKALPGAITYMRASQVNSSVRVLTIDGKAPGQLGYLLSSRPPSSPGHELRR